MDYNTLTLQLTTYVHTNVYKQRVQFNLYTYTYIFLYSNTHTHTYADTHTYIVYTNLQELVNFTLLCFASTLLLGQLNN